MRIGSQLSPPAVFCPFSQTGMSSEAERLHRNWKDLFASIANSIAMGSQYQNLLSALATWARDAAVDNWDGQGASHVNKGSLDYAGRIAQMLPVTVPAPEVSVDPDGEVSIDWQRDPRRSLSMSIDATGTLRYASIVGSSENFGLEPWRDEIPESVFHLLQKVVIQDEAL